jgi:hypothetical protein
MAKNFDIRRYLDDADSRFSSFQGDDYDDFEGDDFDFFEGEDDYSMASGASEMVKSPSPYQINVTNTTAGTLTAVMFGLNQFLLSTNFGSAVGLTVAPAQTNVSYLQLLQQSGSQPFETSLIRVQSSNATQVTQILTVTITDANGQSATLPIITQSYFSSYQQQSGILDIPYQLKLDANTNISTPVLANTTVTYTFFPAEKVNVAKGLAGRQAVQVYGNPQVNLGGMTFPKRPQLARKKKRMLR